MKRITILNGITDDQFPELENGLKLLKERGEGQFACECFTLRGMNIQYCCGCWSCWVKTPGECTQQDEMPKVLESIIHSDLTVFVSPVSMGFVSALLKKANDKMIPLVHPYIGIFEKECHHIKRYEKYPKLGLVLVDKDIRSLSDVSIITDLYKRLALNMKTQLAFTGLTSGSVEVLENEIRRI